MSDGGEASQDRDFAATGGDSQPWHAMTMGASNGQNFAASGSDDEPEHEPVTWKAASTHLTIASLAFCMAAIIPAIVEPQRALEALLYVSGGLAVAVSVRFGSLRLARHAFFVAPPVLSFGQLLVLAAVPSAALEERVDGLINNTLLGALRIASMSFAYGACFVYAPIGDRAVAGLAGATLALGAANTALVGARVESAEARAFVLTMLPLLNMLPFVCGVLMRPLLRHVWGIERGRADPLDDVEKAAGSPGGARPRPGSAGASSLGGPPSRGTPSSEVSSLPTPEGPASPPSEVASCSPSEHSDGDAGGGGGASASGGGSPDGRRPSAGGALQAGGRRTAALRCPTARPTRASRRRWRRRRRCWGPTCRASPSRSRLRRRSGASSVEAAAAASTASTRRGAAARRRSTRRRTSSRPKRGSAGARARRTSTMATRRRRRRPRSPGGPLQDPPEAAAAPPSCIFLDFARLAQVSDRGPQYVRLKVLHNRPSRPAPPAWPSPHAHRTVRFPSVSASLSNKRSAS